MTGSPAHTLRLKRRGLLKPAYYADVVIFDFDAVEGPSTFEDPIQLSTGVQHVFVNGEHTIRDGEYTGATGGRFVRGPGWTGWAEDTHAK